MPLISLNRKYFSDLVLHELDPSVGYSRQDINITPAGVVPLGTVVFRAKASANTQATPYAVLTAATALVNTNEFAVVFGDHFEFNPEFTPRAIVANEFNAVAFVGKNGALQLKDYYVKQVAQDVDGAALTDAQFEVLRELLKAQGIILEITLGA